MSEMKKESAKEIFSPVIKKSDRIKTIPYYKDECWTFALMYRSSSSNYNRHFILFSQYLITILNIHGRFLSKIRKSATNTFKKLTETSKSKPQKVWSGRGNGFYDELFLDFLKQNEIYIYSKNSDLKVVFVERFNRTILDLIKEPMYIEGKACWLNHLDDALEIYYNRVHTTTRMTLFESSNDKTISSLIPSKNSKLPKFQVGDYVRVPDKRNIHSKRYTTNCNKEFF